MSDEQLYALSHRWYFDGDRDPLVFQDVSMGLVLQVASYQFFAGGQLSGHISVGVSGWLKRYQLLWPLRFWLAKFVVRSNAVMNSANILTLFDINNDPLIDNLNILSLRLKETHRVCCVVVDNLVSHNVSKKLPVVAWSKYYGVYDEITTRREARKILDIFYAHRNIFDSNLKHLGVINADKRAGFLRFVARELKQIVREIIAIKKLLLAQQPLLVLLGSDAHRIGRIIVQLARQLNIRTAVMQHGATVGMYGYVPVLADCFLAWGDQTRKWLVDRGVHNEKVRIVGNPRLDRWLALQPQRKRDEPRLILCSPPAGLEATKNIMGAFFRAAEKSKLRAYLKLHPSEKNISWYQDRIPSKYNQPNVIITGSFDKANVSLGDIVVLASSSAGVDAVTMGAVVVNIIMEDWPCPIRYSAYKVGFDININQLEQTILRAIELDFTEYKAGRLEFLAENLGVSEVSAASRAVAELNKLILTAHTREL